MKTKIDRLTADLVTLSAITDSTSVEIMLMPWGKVECTNGDFIVDDESATLIIAKFGMGKKPIPIDYEHASEGGKFGTASGAAPAAGWITEIHAKKGEGIFATVKWNDAAKAMIRADEYRFLSPVISVRREDKKAVAVYSAALTNTPAIIDMERVAASEDKIGETKMDLKELKAALAAAGISLADDADDTAVLTAAKLFIETSKKGDAPLSTIAAKLGLGKDSTADVIVAKVAELQTNVPASEYKIVASRLEALELAAKDQQAQQLVADAIEAAKLNPNDDKQMTWARGYSKADPIAFKAWAEASPQLYGAGRLVDKQLKKAVPDTREGVIVAAKAEYNENKSKLDGVKIDAFVNQSLREKDLAVLTAGEKTELLKA